MYFFLIIFWDILWTSWGYVIELCLQCRVIYRINWITLLVPLMSSPIPPSFPSGFRRAVLIIMLDVSINTKFLQSKHNARYDTYTPVFVMQLIQGRNLKLKSGGGVLANNFLLVKLTKFTNSPFSF